MSQIDAVNLHNELNRLSSVTERRDDLHRWLAQAPAPRQVPGEVAVDDNAVHVKVLGYEISATPRPVRTEGGYAIEYDFKVPFDGATASVWRMYLWENGTLTTGPSTDSAKVCDFNNQYVKQAVVLAVTNALLHSAVFSPAAGEAAS